MTTNSHQRIESTANPYATPKSDTSVQTPEQYGNAKLFARHGRIGRMRYFVYSAFATFLMYFFGIGLAIAIPAMQDAGMAMGSAVTTALGVIAVILFVVFFLLSLTLTRRRLNDMNLTGWLLIIMLIPYLNILFALVLLVAPGTTYSNNYGLPPPPNNTALKIATAIIIGLPLIGILFATIL